MWHLDNVSLEVALGISQFLVFILFFIIGVGAWVFYFSNKEKKEPIETTLNSQNNGSFLRYGISLDMICREARREIDMTLYGSPNHPEHHHTSKLIDAETKLRWADPNYRVEDKLRRTPFTQEKIDGFHQEALNMVSSGEDLNKREICISHFKIRAPVPNHVINRHHIEALKMIRRGEYD